jgi:FlaA1/EpsC-like NDP-sugar epimerase
MDMGNLKQKKDQNTTDFELHTAGDDKPSGSVANSNGKAKSTVLRYRRALIVFVHVALFALSLLMSFGLAYNFSGLKEWFYPLYLPMLSVILVIKLLVFWRFNLYQGWWRYVSLYDLIRITIASHVSLFIFVVTFFLVAAVGPRVYPSFDNIFPLERFETFRQSIFLLDWACTIAMVCGVRIAVRLYHEEFCQLSGGRLIRTLIVGAGDSGEMALREIHRMAVEQYEVVGLLDDDPSKHGATILGCKVLGSPDNIKEFCEKHQIDEVLIAQSSGSPRDVRKIVEKCQGTNVRFRTVPALKDLISGKIRVSQMREIDINDLLGREPAKLDCEAISNYIHNKVVMITGAGGSIGSEMCRQIGNFAPARLVLVEQAENPLFFIEREMRRKFPELNITVYICDIFDRDRVDLIFGKERPNAVFHAAAHKHVPLMEQNPTEAVKNNIFGTKNCADAAAKYGCQKFVMISTDKAVNPTSVMGCSKRIAEMYIQGINAPGGTQFVTVRFGNVLGSNGSVVPIFKEQILQGGPVMVTHPDMRRYFMTIPEAAQLVMQAAAIGKGGEIFLLDMGESVKIVDLARDMITLSGFTPGEDIEIQFSGVRPGEKLFEELSLEGEDMSPTSHEKIAVWLKTPVDRKTLLKGFDELGNLTQCQQPDEVRWAMKKLVPEFHFVGDGETKAPTIGPAVVAAEATQNMKR